MVNVPAEDYEEFDDLLDNLSGISSSMDEMEMAVPQLSQEDIESLYALAHQHYENKKYQDSGYLFRLLMLADEEDPRHWMGLAASCQQNKQYHEAIVLYALTGKLDSENPYLPLHAAECLFAIKEVEKGLEALNFADAIAKKNNYFSIRQEIDILRSAWENGPLVKI